MGENRRVAAAGSFPPLSRSSGRPPGASAVSRCNTSALPGRAGRAGRVGVQRALSQSKLARWESAGTSRENAPSAGAVK